MAPPASPRWPATKMESVLCTGPACIARTHPLGKCRPVRKNGSSASLTGHVMIHRMRALLLVLDGVGCGNAPDAAAYGDAGANTLGHLFARVPDLFLPALFSLGLWKIITADVFDPRSQHTIASYGRLREQSPGKDTTTGHWELAGVILDEPFPVMPRFPDQLVSAIE